MDSDDLHVITLLSRHPAWPLLEAYWEEKREQEIRKLGRKALSGQISQEEQHVESGRWKGIRAVLATPAQAEAELRRILETQEGTNA